MPINGIANQDAIAPTVTTTAIPNTKRVFVTSTLQGSNLGGLEGADTICMNRASAVGLPGTWIALLSTYTINARSRIHYNWDVLKNMAGEIIATSEEDLWDGTLNTGIIYDEEGKITTGYVWTGSYKSEYGFGCEEWFGPMLTTQEWYEKVGQVDKYDNGWFDANTINCFDSARLYCVEQ